jgi:putative acetyltransferase
VAIASGVAVRHKQDNRRHEEGHCVAERLASTWSCSVGGPRDVTARPVIDMDSVSPGHVIRTYRDSDLVGVIACFTESVRVIAGRYYRAEQIAVWAPENVDLDSWRRRLSNGGVFVACAWCLGKNAKALEADVSLAARPLFEAAGFGVEREQSVEYRGAVFRNFRMRRPGLPSQ